MKISKEFKIGIVTIITLLGFFMLFNFLKGQNIFSSGRIFIVKFEDVKGLAPSKPVTINGLRVGQVKEIKIIDNTKPIYFDVVLTIDKDIEFSKKTVAEIYEPGLMSGSAVRLVLDYGPDIAKSGDYLQGSVAKGVMDGITKQLSPTQAKLDSVLVSFNHTLHGVNNILDEEVQRDIKVVLRNLNNTVQSFDKTANSLTNTSNSANNFIKNNQKNLTETLVSAKINMDKFGKTADKLNELQLEKTIANFENASENLNNLLADINNGQGTLGKLAKDDTLLNDLQTTINSMNSLVEDLKKNPSRYVNISVFGKKQKIEP